MTLPCQLNVERTNIQSLHWQRENETLYFFSIFGGPDQSYSHSFDVINHTTLFIPVVSRAEEGRYICKIVTNREILLIEYTTYLYIIGKHLKG